MTILMLLLLMMMMMMMMIRRRRRRISDPRPVDEGSSNVSQSSKYLRVAGSSNFVSGFAGIGTTWFRSLIIVCVIVKNFWESFSLVVVYEVCSRNDTK